MSTTLRDLLQLPERPAALRDSALVMIDCQNTYREGVMRLDGVEEAISAAARLLARARTAGIPIFHVMHDGGAGTPYDVNAEIGKISAEVAPLPDEPVIIKNFPDAFVHTDLDEQLRRTSRLDLMLTGFMTHMCVNSTARGAFNLGYRPTVIAETTATRALPGITGAPVSSATLSAAALAAIADLFALVVPKSDDIPD